MYDALLKQKTIINWSKDGDYNSKYFHSVLRDKIKKLLIHINEIKTETTELKGTT